jgi:hypothetical protein
MLAEHTSFMLLCPGIEWAWNTATIVASSRCSCLFRNEWNHELRVRLTRLTGPGRRSDVRSHWLRESRTGHSEQCNSEHLLASSRMITSLELFPKYYAAVTEIRRYLDNGREGRQRKGREASSRKEESESPRSMFILRLQCPSRRSKHCETLLSYHALECSMP